MCEASTQGNVEQGYMDWVIHPAIHVFALSYIT